MDFAHGVLLLLIGLPITFGLFFVLMWAEMPEVDKEKDLTDIQKQLIDLFKIK